MHSRRSAHCFPRQAHQNSHVEERHSRKIVLTDASEKVSKRYAGLSEWWWVSSSLYSSRVSSEAASAAASSGIQKIWSFYVIPLFWINSIYTSEV